MQEFKVRVPWGTFGPNGQWRHNQNISMSAAEQRRQNVENGFLPELNTWGRSDRQEYDARQALFAGTWQNRQGRANEWTPAATKDAYGVFVIIGVCVVSLVGVIAAVFA